MMGLLEGIVVFAAIATVAALLYAVACWAERGNKTW